MNQNKDRRQQTDLNLESAFIAHQLKTPLSVIIARAELLLLADIDPQIKQNINEIYLAGIRATSILDNILLFVKGKSIGTFYPVKIDDVIVDTLSLFERQFRNAQIVLEMHLMASSIHINGNGYLIQQVIFNIVMNALQALESWEGKRILKVMTLVRGDMLDLVIADTGPGIPAGDSENIFTPFFTTKKIGSGLGLSFARSVIAEHDGTITVSPSGEGCCFVISLPIPETTSPIPEKLA